MALLRSFPSGVEAKPSVSASTLRVSVSTSEKLLDVCNAAATANHTRLTTYNGPLPTPIPALPAASVSSPGDSHLAKARRSC